MDILIWLKLILFLFSPLVFAEVNTCPSAEIFQKSYEFLSEKTWGELPLTYRLKSSHEVTKGCVGAFSRFKKVALLLQKSGVDLRASLESALEFSKLADTQTDSFVEIFKKIFLVQYFNFDFESSFKVSLEFSKQNPKTALVMRDDFLALVSFCMQEKGLGLPIKSCAQTAIQVVRTNKNSDRSIFDDWKNCYDFLRKDARLGLAVKTALDENQEILKGGPGACENFKKTFEYATHPKGLALDPRAALDIAKTIAAETRPREVP